MRPATRRQPKSREPGFDRVRRSSAEVSKIHQVRGTPPRPIGRNRGALEHLGESSYKSQPGPNDLWGLPRIPPNHVSVSNPFLETAVQQSPAGAATQQMDVGTQPEAPMTQAPSPEEARQAREEKLMEFVAEMRAAGHPRQAILAQLLPANVSETEANLTIDNADLFAGMMGRPHPIDINPSVREQIEKQGPMLVTDSLTRQRDAEASDEQNVAITLDQAKAMAAQGRGKQEVFDFLVSSGAPTEQAQQVIEGLPFKDAGEAPKKRFGFLRR